MSAVTARAHVQSRRGAAESADQVSHINCRFSMHLGAVVTILVP